jgi:hypothetical protein
MFINVYFLYSLFTSFQLLMLVRGSVPESHNITFIQQEQRRWQLGDKIELRNILYAEEPGAAPVNAAMRTSSRGGKN